MAKVLTSITVNAPTGAITPAVDDTFAFTGTPGFTGSGGVTRYDFKWEVDDGGGYVTIGAAGTGLITADTNPLVNANSQTANSITVTCDEAGTYTIRMVGAPATGGAYTVVSDTRDVTVSGAAPVLTADAGAFAFTGTAAGLELGLDVSWIYSDLGTPAFDLDFVNRRYYWGGIGHLEADFSAAGTGMTFDNYGMTPGAAGYLRQTLSALGMTNADTVGTIVARVYVVTGIPTSNNYVYSLSDGTDGEQIRLQHFTTGNVTQGIRDNSVNVVTVATAAANNTKMVKGIAWTLNNTDTCVDTAAAVNDAACTMPTIAATGHLTVGAAYNATTNWEFGAIGRLIGYNLKLSDADLQTVTTYLYNLPSNYVIATTAGSYAATGTDASPEIGRVAIAGAGSFAITGTAAALEYGYEIGAEAGAYALTGQAAGFLTDRVVGTEAGAFAVTGTAAGLEYGHEVAADAGTFAFTGSEATLAIDANKTIVAGAGSFAVSGAAAGLEHGREVAADAGAYAVSGTAAALEYGREIAADAGAYDVTGAAAALELGREVAAEAGAYAIAGTAATLTVSGGNKTLIAEAGSFAVSGAAASLELGREVVAGAGSFALTGSTAALEYGREATAGVGSYAVSGFDVALEHGSLIAAMAGSFAVTGADATLAIEGAGITLTAEAGAFAMTGAAAGLEVARLVDAGAGSFALTGTAAGLAIVVPPRPRTRRGFAIHEAPDRPIDRGRGGRPTQLARSGRPTFRG